MSEGRQFGRCSIHWRSAIAIEGNGGGENIQCKTNDISVDGVSVICPRNVAIGQALTIYLLIDPGDTTHPQLVFEAQGRVMNNVLSSQQGGFRLGIQFIKFVGDSQRHLLKHLPKEVLRPPRPPAAASAASAAATATAAAPEAPRAMPAEALPEAETMHEPESMAPAAAAPVDEVTPTATEPPADGEIPSQS